MEPAVALRPVDPGLRAAAKAADCIVAGLLASQLTPALIILRYGPPALDIDLTSLKQVIFLYLGYLLLVTPPTLLLFQVCAMSVWRTTPGKLLVGLRVTAADGGRPGFWRCQLRTVAEIVSGAALALGYLNVLWDPQRRTWHDHVSGTFVRELTERRVSWFGKSWPRLPFAAAVSATIIVLGVAACALAPTVYSWIDPAHSPADRNIARGLVAYQSGYRGKALEEFSKAVAADPRSALAYANRGALHGDMGHLDLQIADCTMAIRLDSTQVFAWLGRANAYRLQGRFAESASDYSAVIRARPAWSGLVFAYRGRGTVRYRQGDYDAAARDYAEGIRIAMAKYLGTSDYNKGDQFREAIAMCDLFGWKASSRAGGPGAAAGRWTPSRPWMAETLGSEAERDRLVREWLGD